MDASLFSLLTLGLGLGLMHALDADHVMAVSTLSNRQPGFLRTIRFSANWALGHGGVLLLSGLCLFGFGLALPENLQRAAELSVGVLLVVLGVVCFISFRRQKVRFERHTHGEIEHSHWTVDGHAHNKDAKGKHAPVMVGVLHGLAGSAPALALIPAVTQGNLWHAMSYLIVFSLGVMISMVLFGLGFGFIQARILANYERVFEWNRRFIAAASIGFGGYWIVQAI
ncbi:Uncharacterised protein [BD1-7 clade bacterium]|uniref:Urease accessory protein UreH-like transmembrane domain-containing protein n=1 Tax=BD1-7 clade bacterium TaxID=2029982 RepID=A0A5S9PEU5_9GAMM|nr:Uncharacterised protein [BD1-7 clade bacterium]CAA0102191.1 Uncharacterised protein [BD1-7 clade bacterium]